VWEKWIWEAAGLRMNSEFLSVNMKAFRSTTSLYETQMYGAHRSIAYFAFALLIIPEAKIKFQLSWVTSLGRADDHNIDNRLHLFVVLTAIQCLTKQQCQKSASGTARTRMDAFGAKPDMSR
jgi:hypothetical protein